MASIGSDRLSGAEEEHEEDGSSERSLVSSRHLETPGADTSTIIHMLRNVLAEQRELKLQQQALKVFHHLPYILSPLAYDSSANRLCSFHILPNYRHPFNVYKQNMLISVV